MSDPAVISDIGVMSTAFDSAAQVPTVCDPAVISHIAGMVNTTFDSTVDSSYGRPNYFDKIE